MKKHYIWAALVSILPVFFYFGWQTDDAFISREVAKNFVETGVWAWDGQATENQNATTSPLHVAYISALGWVFGFDNVAKAEAIINAVGFIAVILWIFARLSSDKDRQIFSAALVAAPYSIFWLFGGLETGLAVVLFTLVYAQLYLWLLDRREVPPNRVCVFFLCAIRPDYIVLLGALGLAVLIKAGLRRALIFGFPIAIALGIYFAGVVAFLGTLFPASYYFKIEALDGEQLFKNGIRYLKDYWEWSLWVPLFAFLISVGVIFRSPDRKSLAIFLGAVLVLPAVVVVNGGDWMLGFRFFAPCIVMYTFVVFSLSEQWLARRSMPGMAIIYGVAGIVFISNLLGPLHNFSDLNEHEYNRNFYQLALTQRGRIQADPDKSYDLVYGPLLERLNGDESVEHLGLSEAGYIAFKFDRMTTDVQGLTIPKLARLRSEFGTDSSQFAAEIDQRGITHFLFWLKESPEGLRPRVARQIFALYFDDGIVLEDCLFHQLVDDLYRYTKGNRGPLHVCLVARPDV